jgi:glycosyltransferase involved in cell wall biosynthesis
MTLPNDVDSELLISVIIPTHNGAKTIVHTLRSLASQSLPPNRYEVIVVDNASTDNSAQVVQEFIASSESSVSVLYVYEPRLGAHHARNHGSLGASAPILAYTDDDVVVDSGWLKALLEMHKDPQVASVGGRVLPSWQVQPPEWLQSLPAGNLSLLDLGDTISVRQGPDIYSCNMTVLRSALLEVGGFHPELVGSAYIGDGETGMLQDLLDAGWKIMYTPSAVVWHMIPESRMTMKYLIRRYKNQAAADEFRTYRKNVTPRPRLLARAFSWIIRAEVRGLEGFMLKLLGKRNWRFFRLIMAYYQSRAIYCLRLIYDHNLRELLSQKSWI